MKLTGLVQLDELVNPLHRHWIVELYGDQQVVLRVLHYMIAYRSSVDRVYVLFNVEFGGLDTLYMIRLCRIFNCRLDNILVSRAFRLDDTARILEELSGLSGSLVLIVYPYSYIPIDPSKYHEATRITGLAMKIAMNNQVVLFNTTTRHGRYKPEGGSFHHHVVKVIVRLVKHGDSIIAELTKHPVKEKQWRSIPISLLEHPLKPRAQATILEWAVPRETSKSARPLSCRAYTTHV